MADMVKRSVAASRDDYASDLPIPPGETLAEELEERGLDHSAFAERVGVSSRFLSGVLNGEQPLTPELALRLQRELDIPAILWLRLEARYRLALAVAGAA